MKPNKFDGVSELEDTIEDEVGVEPRKESNEEGSEETEDSEEFVPLNLKLSRSFLSTGS